MRLNPAEMKLTDFMKEGSIDFQDIVIERLIAANGGYILDDYDHDETFSDHRDAALKRLKIATDRYDPDFEYGSITEIDSLIDEYDFGPGVLTSREPAWSWNTVSLGEISDIRKLLGRKYNTREDMPLPDRFIFSEMHDRKLLTLGIKNTPFERTYGANQFIIEVTDHRFLSDYVQLFLMSDNVSISIAFNRAGNVRKQVRVEDFRRVRIPDIPQDVQLVVVKKFMPRTLGSHIHANELYHFISKQFGEEY